MAKVYRLVELQLRPGVEAEDFERFVVEEVYPLPNHVGWNYSLLRSDRGHGEGQYLIMYAADSAEVRDRTDSGQRSDEDQQVRDAKAALWEKARAMTNFIYTDYVVLDG